MNPVEYQCDKYDVLLTLMFGKLYELNEEEDEWEPVDWDIIAEDEEMNDHYSWVFSKLKADEDKAIKADPYNSLFS